VNNLLSSFGSLGRDEVIQRIEKAGIPVNARPEQLSMTQFLRVYNLFQ
jgi:hypothetical protein